MPYSGIDINRHFAGANLKPSLLMLVAGLVSTRNSNEDEYITGDSNIDPCAQNLKKSIIIY